MVENELNISTATDNSFLIKELESLGIEDVPNFLSSQITTFLTINGNSNMFNKVKCLLDLNKPIDAFLELSDQVNFSNIKITGPNIVRKNVNNLRSFISEIPRKVRNVPNTFILGTQAHRMVENIAIFGLSKINEDNIKLIEKNKKVVGLEITERKIATQECLLDNDQETVAHPSSFYYFEEGLQPPKGESLNSWLYSLIKGNLLSIYSNNMFPDKPFDVAEILKDKSSRGKMLAALQAAHVLLNIKQQKGLSLWRSKEKNINKFCYNEIDEYKALNWLTILRQVVESQYETKSNSSFLAELSLGEVKISCKHRLLKDGVLKIKGGIADIIKINWEEDSEQNLVKISDKEAIPFNLLVGHIDKLFRSQSKKYNRTNEGGIIYKRELYRNISSLYSELFNSLGSSIIDNLRIEIIDYKFPAGDGGWWTSFNVNDLPYEEHTEKLNEYLFNLASQFCWVIKWKEKSGLDNSNFGNNNDWENFGVSLEEITKFVFDNRIFDKIHGKLTYQTPEKNIVEPISMPNSVEDFIVWANKIIDKKIFLLEKTEQRIKRLKTLEMLLKVSNPERTMETIRVSPEVLPEDLNSLFITYNSINYLVLEEFKNIIENRDTNGEWTIKNAFYYSDQKIAVFTIEKIMEDGNIFPFRVAINNKAEFTIKGPQEFGFYRGVLTSSKQLCGVKEKVSDREQLFYNILASLKGREETKFFNSLTDSDKILLDGLGRPVSKVENKPWVVNQDLMTGKWTIDSKALENALENTDYPGLNKISEILGQEKRNRAVQVFCPLPSHPNTRTEAAYFYPEQNAIYCFDCQELIHLPETRSNFVSRTEKYSWPGGLKFDDYRGVSKGRQDTMESFVDISLLFKDDKDATDYLKSRGFDWKDFGPRCGYIPPELINYLSKLISQKEYLEFKNRKNNSYLNIENIISSFPDEDFERYWQSIESDKKERLKGILTVRSISDYKNRALVLRIREGKEDSLGGRIIVPTYWMSQINKFSLVPTNLIGRGVENKKGLYKGRKYYKVPIIQSNAKGKRPTPPGIWVPDVSSFLLGHLRENLIIVFEGTTNSVSFSKMYPRYKNNTVVVEGTGYRNFIALLDWLKFTGTVCLAHDFDKGGASAAERMKKQLEFQNYKKVTTIHSLLDKEIIESENIPPYDVSRFEDGDLFEYKKDMNDIYLSLIKKGLIK